MDQEKEKSTVSVPKGIKRKLFRSCDYFIPGGYSAEILLANKAMKAFMQGNGSDKDTTG